MLPLVAKVHGFRMPYPCATVTVVQLSSQQVRLALVCGHNHPPPHIDSLSIPTVDSTCISTNRNDTLIPAGTAATGRVLWGSNEVYGIATESQCSLWVSAGSKPFLPELDILFIKHYQLRDTKTSRNVNKQCMKPCHRLQQVFICVSQSSPFMVSRLETTRAKARENFFAEGGLSPWCRRRRHSGRSLPVDVTGPLELLTPLLVSVITCTNTPVQYEQFRFDDKTANV